MKKLLRKSTAVLLAVIMIVFCGITGTFAIIDADGLRVTATSNIANAVSRVYNEDEKTVTVTYYLKTAKNLLCGDWYLTYDHDVLQFSDANYDENKELSNVMPIIYKRGGAVVNPNYKGDDETAMPCVYASFTNTELYNFSNEEIKDNVFVTVTFDIIGEYAGETEINLNVDILEACVITDSEIYDQYDSCYIMNDEFYYCFDYIYNSNPTDLFESEYEALAELSASAPATPDEGATEPSTTEKPETEPIVTDGLKVTATSNIANAVSEVYSEADKTVTVTYYLKTAKNLLCGNWYLTYDHDVLQFSDANYDENTELSNVMPIIFKRSGAVVNPNYKDDDETAIPCVYASFSNTKLYNFLNEEVKDNVFVTVTFDIIGEYAGETEINLNVDILEAGVITDSEVYDQYNECYIGDGKFHYIYEYIDHSNPTDLFESEYEALAELSAGTIATPDEGATEPSTTENPVTEPSTTEPVPGNSFVVTCTSNIANSAAQKYTEGVDDTVTVYFYLTAQQRISAGEWMLTYDSSILRLTDDEGMMPYITKGDKINPNYDNDTAYGSFSNVSEGYDFSDEQILVKATFKIVGDYTKDTVVNLNVENMVGIDVDYSKFVEYIIDGMPKELFDSQCSARIAFEGGVPTEPAATEPPTTEPSTTEPPTTEPPTTEPSTTEPPTTEPPTTEPPTTEPPTTEPPTTEPPTTEPPTTEPPTTEPPTTEPPTTEPPTTEPPTTEPPTTEPPTEVVLTDKNTNISVVTDTDAEVMVETLTSREDVEAVYAVLGDTNKLITVYDISLVKDGVTVQPDGAVTVKIPASSESAKVYRLEADGTLTDMNAVFADGYLEFTTEHFSVYAVVDEKPEATPDEPIKIKGDVNSDGEYNIRDAAAIQLYIAQLYNGTFDESVADVNGDGEIGIKDAAYIQLDLAKLL